MVKIPVLKIVLLVLFIGVITVTVSAANLTANQTPVTYTIPAPLVTVTEETTPVPPPAGTEPPAPLVTVTGETTPVPPPAGTEPPAPAATVTEVTTPVPAPEKTAGQTVSPTLDAAAPANPPAKTTESAQVVGKNNNLVIEPINPELLQYLEKERVQSAQKQGTFRALQLSPLSVHATGYVPASVNYSHLQGPFVVETSTQQPGTVPSAYSGVFPGSYDLRTAGKVTAVRDQGTAGSCWAHAAYGSLESYLLQAEAWDFSENNIKNLLSDTSSEGYDRDANLDGGNAIMATAYLARWTGPVKETDDPYSVISSVSLVLVPVKHVQNVYFIPPRTTPADNTNIKTALTSYGAVDTSMYIDSGAQSSLDSSYWKQSTGSYYYYGSSSVNHDVTIIGWDDAYDKSNFATAPAGNGAFLIRNSWGTGWGNSGYFWISYYDTRIGKNNYVFTAEKARNYDRVYQYDPLGHVGRTGYPGSPTIWMANVFTSTSVSPETLTAVSFYTTDVNTAYEIYIYRNPTPGGPKNGGTLVSSMTGAFLNAGYHTIRMSTKPILQPGNTFSVVVKLTNPSLVVQPMGFEYYYDAGPRSFSSSQATANAGESWISYDGVSWDDLTTIFTNSNACIKAFTDTGDKIGYYQPGSRGIWRLDFNRNGAWSGAVIDGQYSFGTTGYIPVTGDWNNDGKTEVGTFYNGVWRLDYSGNGKWDGGVIDRVYVLGTTGSVPVTGDWNNDGKTEIGYYQPGIKGIWRLDYNGNGRWDGGVIDRAYVLGTTDSIPVTGDWNNNGKDEIGYYQPGIKGIWRLDYNGNGVWNGGVTDRQYSFGTTGYVPVTGDWNNDGKTEVGTFYNGVWRLDYNGNGAWNGPVTDRQYWFGTTGYIPVTGDW